MSCHVGSHVAPCFHLASTLWLHSSTYLSKSERQGCLDQDSLGQSGAAGAKPPAKAADALLVVFLEPHLHVFSPGPNLAK